MFSFSYSVVIPTYNRESSIARAIESVLSQTHPANEIIVIDDGSIDNTLEVVSSFSCDRIKIIYDSVNKGVAEVRNIAVRAANFPWVAFLDSDDEWLPDKMMRQMKVLAEAESDVSGSVTGYTIIDSRSQHCSNFIPNDCKITWSYNLLGCRLGPGSTLVVSKNLFLASQGFNNQLKRLEDWEWMIRFLEKHRLVCVSEPLVLLYKNNQPPILDILDSLERVSAMHRDRIYKSSWIQGRKFDAGLLTERAAGAFYEEKIIDAGILTLRSMFAYPFRDALFFRILIRRVFYKFLSFLG